MFLFWLTVGTLFAMYIAQHVALNSVLANVRQLEGLRTHQQQQIATLSQQLERTGERVSENVDSLQFVHKQMDEVHLRMAAHNNRRNGE